MRLLLPYFLLLLLPVLGYAKSDKKEIDPIVAFLNEIPEKIESLKFTRRDEATCLKIAKGSKEYGLTAELILAEYYRSNESRPDKAIKLVGHRILDSKQVREWERANEKAEREAERQYRKDLRQWKSDVRTAKREDKAPPEEPKEPSGIFVPLPDTREWDINNDNAVVAVELAKCLAEGERPQEALVIIDRVGRKFGNETRVLAAECAGDLFVGMRRLEKGIDIYGYALKVLTSLGDEEYVGGGKSRKIFSAEQQILRRRISKKKEEAHHLLEIEKYGPGWIAYREAEMVRQNKKSYLHSYMLHEQIIEDFPDTVYSEAAKCYNIKTLLTLTDTESYENSKAYIDTVEEQIDVLEKKAKAALKAKANKGTINELIEKFKNKKEYLVKVKSIPYGKKASKEAQERLEGFLEEKKWGLYRGESLLDLATHFLYVEMDADDAKEYYDRAAEWFEKINELEAGLAAYEVPGKAADISAPPKDERYKDKWTNTKLSKVSTGDVFNRTTATWYLASKHKDVILGRGLLAYVDEDYEKAKAIWEDIYKLDPYFENQRNSGWGNVHSRLMRSVEKTPGSIYLDPEQMKKIRGEKQRLAVYLADLHYVNEKPLKARDIYQKMLDGEYGRLSREEKAIAIFGVFAANCWDFKVDEVAFLETYLNDLRGTSVEARALFGAGNRSAVQGRPQDFTKAIRYFELLQKNCPRSEEALKGYFAMGRLYRYWSKVDDSKKEDARKYLEKYIEKKKEKGYVGIAKKYLKEINQG